MTFGYTLGIRAYGLAIRLASPFHAKAKLWVKGRKAWRDRLKEATQGKKDWIWVHCSSLGEFEQGRPLIEAIKQRNPNQPLLLTFFSPSGYEVRKNYPVADVVTYLPLDTVGNARDFLDIVPVKQAIFIKYDLWLNFLGELSRRSIPHFLVSALLDSKSRFLKSSLKGAYHKAFRNFSWIFTQDEGTRKLVEERVGVSRVSVSGDTRFDRAIQLPSQFQEVEGIREFVGESPVIVVGSSHAKDEEVFMPAIEELRDLGLKWIVAPHEINKERIAGLVGGSQGKMGQYSQMDRISSDTELLWIDNVGMLSRLYHYATVTYIGGGFGKGIHNTQEPAVYGNPIFFGPHYHAFREAKAMVEMETAFVVRDAGVFSEAVRKLVCSYQRLEEISLKNKAYMNDQAGATEVVLQKLAEIE